MDEIQSGPLVTLRYNLLLSAVRRELLVFNRSPYFERPDQLNPLVLQALRRGVATRVLYEASHWSDPAEESFRAAMEVYHGAGVVGRVVDELPCKMAVADRQTALVAMTTSARMHIAVPAATFMDDASNVSLQADVFEEHWARSEPLPRADQ